MIEEWLKGQGSTYVLPELFEHENYTLEFWTNVSLEDNWQDVNVPAIHIGGWYDCMQQGTIDGFMGYQYLGGAGAQGNSKLIMGPWTHGGGTGQLVYPENAKDTFSSDMFWDMVNQYTMSGPNNYDSWPTVSYYVLGDVDDIDAPGKEWRYADDWPIPSTETEWFFHENETLSKTPPGNYVPLTYAYDPMDPVPTVGGQNLKLPAGPYDQIPVENRSDVLVFTSPVLANPYEATGYVKAWLYVSSDCPDTDFSVKLTDVYPDGRSMLITDGILRMRNRNGTDHWEFMEPGEIYEMEVDLWSTSYVWNTGHKIRVAISSSNYPRFLNNPNTADGIYANTTYNIAHNTLYLDDIHQSCIVLPGVDRGVVSTPPNKPDISGPTSGKAGMKKSYTCRIIDPDGDKVSILFDWGDGTSSGWVGPFDSGETFEVSHIWEEKGTYNIRIKAKDIGGTQSEWSDIFKVGIPGEKKISKADTVQLIKKLVDRFPISKKIFPLPIFERVFDFKVTDLISFDP